MSNNHINESGNLHMIDVSGKDITLRVATASGIITLNDKAFSSIIDFNNKKGDVLKKHTDRKSCDISATVYLGSDTSNLDYPYSWAFFIEHDKQDLEINLNPGDMVLYRGCDLPHWRNECECLNQGQVFLHYNKDGEDASLYDGRVLPGVPKRYQK